MFKASRVTMLAGAGLVSIGFGRPSEAIGVGQHDMSDDLLDQTVVSPVYSVTVDLDDDTGYCRFDQLAVFSDGSTAVRWGVDVCSTGRITVYD